MIGACRTDGNQIIFLATHLGMAIRFGENDVRSMGRPAYGVRGIDLGKGDYWSVLPPLRSNGRRMAPAGFSFADPFHYRAGLRQAHRCGRVPAADPRRQGVINVKTTARNGKVSAILLVDDSSELMVISQYGKIIRIDTKTIRAAGRSTQGVRLLHLEEEDKVAAAVVIPPEEAKIEPENGTLLQ